MIPGMAKYFSARVPRYTSYPTAPHFSAEVDAKRYESWLSRIDPNSELSLYLHVPFCRQMCWYCGCNMRVIARYSPVTSYVDTLIREIELVAQIVPKGVAVGHIHWGGGTPTALAPEDMVRIDETVKRHFNVGTGAEIAVEIDPRTFTAENAAALGKIGTTRASLGVQEFDEKVQTAINRVQPVSMIEATLALLREQGIHEVNFDLMYGLPYQTAETLKKTVELAATMKPHRIALFGYAHVPWMAKNQRMIPEEALPTPLMRFEQAEVAGDALAEQGYVKIGLDHFARPEDTMAVALKEGRLHRNFQGYTDDEGRTIVAFGASAISALPDGFAQNIVETGAYARAVNEGVLPIAKGIASAARIRCARRSSSASCATWRSTWRTSARSMRRTAPGSGKRWISCAGLRRKASSSSKAAGCACPTKRVSPCGSSARCSTPTSLRTRSFATPRQSDLCGRHAARRSASLDRRKIGVSTCHDPG